jgi:hypothetical protein
VRGWWAARTPTLPELRGIVRKNSALVRYEPSGAAAWNRRRERFAGLLGSRRG